MKPYYENTHVRLFHCDFRSHDTGPASTVITDPPYGENMGYAGDDPGSAEGLLDAACAKASQILPRMGHLACFWTMRKLDQPIDSTRSHGLTYRRTLTMYLPKGGARPYMAWLPRTQPIVLAQKYLPTQPTEFHGDLADHVKERMVATGQTCGSLAKALGCNSRLVMKWSRRGDPAWCLPTRRFYPALKSALGLSDAFDALLDRQETSRPPREYSYTHDTYVVQDGNPKTNHPSEKPLSVLRHLVNTLTLPGETVVDFFAGSGTTLLAAQEEGRKAVGYEVNELFCEMAATRLSKTP